MAIRFGYILSCWRHCQYVKQCVDSIREQDVETDIVLFGEKCVHNDANFCVNDCERKGQVARLNEGLQIIKADYVSFMGVDDYLLRTLTMVKDTILFSGKKEWYYGFHWQQMIGKSNFQKLIQAPPFDANRLKTQNYIAGGAVFVRTDILKQFGFEEVFGLGADWILWNKLAQKYQPVELRIPIYVERLGTSHIRIPGTRAIRRALIKRRIRRLWAQ